MKITAVRLRKLRGTLPTSGPFWEERLVRPIDVYDDYRNRQDFEGEPQTDERHLPILAYFVQIETDEGVIGIGGPLPETVAFFIGRRLRPILMGRDPIAHEMLWDQMHRIMVHGRQGDAMLAISALDCALWDLKGRWLNVPIYKLLGGPTRRAVPAYASMLGYVTQDAGRVRERALWAKQQGYTAQKWFFRHGPMSGPEGMRKNVELVRTVREAIGDDDDLMLDCWQSMEPSYVIELASRIAEYRPRWLEECCMPDRIDSYRAIKEKISIPLSGAEHEYTRWGFKRFIDARALDVLQPDIYWCGGISETLKICAYATVHDLITIPHGHSTPAGIHVSVTQSPIHTPYQEYLIKWNDIHQHFLKNPVKPVKGMIHLNDLPGIGMDLDPAKIESEEEAFPA
ncbi:MAG TPA: enolase C-terminal domain-like protein [Acetobacteraceae bacterium]|jgi:L-alanine-DL-glutamate epimerase-like enolase superfamily enzyme|nr:enolase C-terminal domain-like protein [Acetobacteraceae bacterium]